MFRPVSRQRVRPVTVRAVAAMLTAVGSGDAAAQAPPRLPAVDSLVESLLDEGHFPGAAIAVLRDGRPVHVGTYGLARLAHDVPVTERTVFELASRLRWHGLHSLRRSRLSVIVLTDREDAPGELSPMAVAWKVAHAVETGIPA